ncbi:MAG: hypothetical protein ACOH19_07850 [Rhodoglobus sp.]
MNNQTGTIPTARTTAHNDAVQVSAQDISSELARVLGRQLLGIIVDKGARTIQRWIAGEHSPGPEEERRLRDAFQVYRTIATVEGDHTIRAWFMGMNPQLDDDAPADALAANRAKDVMSAARAFVNGG